MRFVGFRPNTEQSFVACRIGDTIYAIPILRVREIVQPLPVTRLPEAVRGVLGAIDHRGEVIPIVDLAPALGLPATDDKKRKWVLLSTAAGAFGLVVRQVFEVFRVAESEVRRAPDVGRGSGFATPDVVNFGKQMAFVLDIDKVALVARPSAESLAAGAP